MSLCKHLNAHGMCQLCVIDIMIWQSQIDPKIEKLEEKLDRILSYINERRLGPTIEIETLEKEERRRYVSDLLQNVAKLAAPGVPVDRTQQTLIDGNPVPQDRGHTELKEDGMQKGYVVLSAEERTKGFVRPVRDSYVHVGVGGSEIDPNNPSRHGRKSPGCGTLTTMGRALAETYARDPKFYSGTFCAGCRKHFPLSEFVWADTQERVGT